MQVELLKLKNNPLGLFLLALGPLAVGLVFALQGTTGVRIELSTELRELWSAPMHLVMVLFLPYLLTLEKQLGTEKWLWTTPTRPWQVILQKWALNVSLAALFGVISMVLLWGQVDLSVLSKQFLIALSTSITFTVLSLMLGSFTGVLVTAVVWSAISSYVLLLVPVALRDPLAAALPSLELTNFQGGDFQAIRILTHVVLMGLATWLLYHRTPRW